MSLANSEEPITFSCAGSQLVGVLHRPHQSQTIGVIVVAGAPQYRVGSHRQFVLLARHLAVAGFPTLRFDYRGMGDSDGEFIGFEGVDDDIDAAVDFLFSQIDGLQRVVLWGLCDGASAAGFYAAKDSRVGGLILLNPWVRTLTTTAQAHIRHYYPAQLVSMAFWQRVIAGKVHVVPALWELWRSLRQTQSHPMESEASGDLPTRVGVSLRHFNGPLLLILSGVDLTAQEFDSAVLHSAAMTTWLAQPQITVKRLANANHTYARGQWRNQVHQWIESWLNDTF